MLCKTNKELLIIILSALSIRECISENAGEIKISKVHLTATVDNEANSMAESDMRQMPHCGNDWGELSKAIVDGTKIP